MAASSRVLCAAALVLVALGGCVQPLSEIGRPCPCSGEIGCCEVTNTCQSRASCPALPEGPDGSPDRSDAGNRDATSHPETGAEGGALVPESGTGEESSPPDVSAEA